jgi:soluble lytic murein transglycosylase-like protein
MSILSALKQQHSSIDDLAKLPQAMIMQMAQKKEISPEMVAPILSRKAELMEAVARSKALQQPAMQPTVMEQVMAKNIQGENPAPQMQQPMPQAMPQQAPQQMPQMPEEAGVGQLPIPERQYAGGGIIAFADGGMSEEDEDYEDSLEEADYQAMIEQGMNAGEEDYTPRFETRQAAGSPQSFPNSARSVGIATPKEQKGDLEERLRSAILQKESGGKRYDKSGKLLTSNKGAEGEMQVMPYTSRDPGFGVKPARSNDPDELRRVGDEYASAMLRRYKDPIVAMIAYNMGPGATDKWLAAGADPRRLPRETQGYISNVSLAHGGEVRHFANEGYVDPMGGYGGDYEEKDTTFDPFQKALADYKKQALERVKTQKALSGTALAAPSATPNATARGNAPAAQDFRDFDQAAALFQAENMGKNAPVQTPEAKKSQFEMYMEDLANRASENKTQRADDKNMALLTAGLGMLGGTSPYAMANIGQGALAGVQNLSESKKQRAAEQAAIDKSMLYATRYKGADELAKQNAAYNRGIKQQQYELDVAKHGTEREKIAINQYQKFIDDQMDALIAKDPVLAADPVAKAKAKQAIENSDIALQLRRRAFPDLPDSSQTRGGNVMKFDASGKQIAG